MKNIEDALLEQAKQTLSSIMANENILPEDRIRAAEVVLGFGLRGDNADAEKK